MDRESGINPVLLWVVGGLSMGCVIVGMIACLFMAAMFLGVNPLGPFIYDAF